MFKICFVLSFYKTESFPERIFSRSALFWNGSDSEMIRT